MQVIFGFMGASALVPAWGFGQGKQTGCTFLR